ncbi:hypothetical protein ABXN37_27170 [Piscinibacter sakaiensis]|uniref:Hypothtical protein n=1 Tax=Piscinibacter sakaiensis TaxID=1547922 RepID=A0A0K8P817_PISS1|nr:hypothetical protein [Piscinibacter sakaiensis]GAP38781.1 hypothtical protein [Piscinibacter sakaiensis]
MKLQISAEAVDILARGMAQAPDLVQRELLTEMTVLTQHLQGEVADALRPPDPGYTGALSASVAGDAFSTPAGVLGVVGSSSPYAPVVEAGRKPGKGVSREGREALAAWAIGKLGVEPAKARSVAFLIARKIKARGVEGRHVFRDTLARNEATAVRALEDAAARIGQQLVGGGAA